MISVIICTHNPKADYLARTLGALQRQTLPREEWELIVVDNASSSRLSDSLDLSWHPCTAIHREEQLGLTPARLRGIRMSCGDPIVFVDDDNVLDPGFLAEARRLTDEYPFLGAFGGQSRGEFETTPEPWTRRYWGNLVIRECRRDSWSNSHLLSESIPLGAGLCVRRKVAERYVSLHDTGQREVLLDRTGQQLLSGGDTDLVSCAFDLGMGSGTFTALTLVHLIPPGRLTEDYLVRLSEGISYSAVVLRSFRPDAYPERPTRGIVGRMADAMRAIRMGRRGRRFQRAIESGARRAEADLAARRNGSSR